MLPRQRNVIPPGPSPKPSMSQKRRLEMIESNRAKPSSAWWIDKSVDHPETEFDNNPHAARPKPSSAWWIDKSGVDHPETEFDNNPHAARVDHHVCHRAGKKGISIPTKEWNSMECRDKSNSIKALYGLDDQQDVHKIDVRILRYSQESCRETFQSGASVMKLVSELFHGKVSLKEPFLHLSVFEATDPKTREPILKCKDNRRLYALKEYAKLCDHDDISRFVYVRYFSRRMVREVQRFKQNSDTTRGLDIRLRTQGNNRKQGNNKKVRRRSR